MKTARGVVNLMEREGGGGLTELGVPPMLPIDKVAAPLCVTMCLGP